MAALNVTLQESYVPGLSSEKGPAKGYIEGLEHRLHEAESLLLQLLPLVTPDQLSAATALLTPGGMRDSPEHMSGRSSPPVLNKKTGIDYWESFPLDTVENVRLWQADCAMHSHFRDELASSGKDSGSSRPNSVDLQREATITQPQPRNQSSISISQQPNFHTMSSDSYRARSSQHAVTTPPTSQPGYLSPQLRTQSWTATNPNANFMQTGYGGTTDQSWQQQQQRNAYQQQQQNQMQMEVDGGFFPSDMKRNLFW